eukprot:TRINITY_DN99455_c0_g1_i1.p1 TRINITY_DN99455_c0_g1~~TRINITY_DN99455_c0_g1_i1.p1  ORF type:complete len:566 (-),score=114.73 TRINITY_DN99455_c0_g1_i1:144-1841(-)
MSAIDAVYLLPSAVHAPLQQSAPLLKQRLRGLARTSQLQRTSQHEASDSILPLVGAFVAAAVVVSPAQKRRQAAAATSSVRPRSSIQRISLAAAESSDSVRSSEAADPLDFGMSEELVLNVPRYESRRTGVLLLNIGTPATTNVDDVREYLSLFLADDRVIEVQPPALKLVILQAILATRPKASAENYKKIWDPVRGSPLLFHSEDLAKALQEEIGDSFEVRIGMQYSKPFVQDALTSLASSGVDNVVLVPMFPHYASGTTGSCLAGAYRTAAELYCTPFLSVLPPFYGHPLYIESMAESMSEIIGPRGRNMDHLLFSFHGVPVDQCSRTDSTGSLCTKRKNCCAKLEKDNRNCYRAQCFETARLLASRLDLEDGKWSIGFQSRLTLRDTVQWIRPYTDEAFVQLAERGVKKLAVVAPSFTADCVETLEELGITGKEEFQEAGGEELVVIPCLNSHKYWVRDLGKILQEHLDDNAQGLPSVGRSRSQASAERSSTSSASSHESSEDVVHENSNSEPVDNQAKKAESEEKAPREEASGKELENPGILSAFRRLSERFNKKEDVATS